MSLGIHCIRKANVINITLIILCRKVNDKAELQCGNKVLLYRSVCIELKFAVPPHPNSLLRF